MQAKPTPLWIRRAAVELGEHVASWRKLQGLTAAQLADRANITRDTLRRIEHGKPVGSDILLSVLRGLGQLDRLVDALDPFETDFGRARAGMVLPQRVRHPKASP